MVIDFCNLDLGPCLLSNFLCSPLNLVPHPRDLLRRKVSQLNGMLHQARHHVVSIGKNLQLPYRPNLPTGLARHHVLHRCN